MEWEEGLYGISYDMQHDHPNHDVVVMREGDKGEVLANVIVGHELEVVGLVVVSQQPFYWNRGVEVIQLGIIEIEGNDVYNLHT